MTPNRGHKNPMKGSPVLPQSERVRQMMEQYVELHDSGMTPKQIAHHFDLASETVYHRLQEIADQAGVSRASLLQTPHAPHTPSGRRFEPVQPVDLTDFRTHFQQANSEITRLIEASTKAIETNEQIAQRIDKEETEWQFSR